MKSDEQILGELRRAAEGLMWLSESDYPLAVVRWETDAATPDFLRRAAAQPPDAPVETESVADFFRPATTTHEDQRAEELETAEKFRVLLRALAANLQDVRVYRIGRINIAVYVLGRAPSGSLIGIATRVVET